MKMWKYIFVIFSLHGLNYLSHYHFADAQVDGYIAGIDYPAYETIPKGLSFTCKGRLPGYYADVQTRCQVWHWCLISGTIYSFLCPNGTVFNQAYRVCDWWTNVDCPLAESLYANNEELYRDGSDLGLAQQKQQPQTGETRRHERLEQLVDLSSTHSADSSTTFEPSQPTLPTVPATIDDSSATTSAIHSDAARAAIEHLQLLLPPHFTTSHELPPIHDEPLHFPFDLTTQNVEPQTITIGPRSTVSPYANNLRRRRRKSRRQRRVRHPSVDFVSVSEFGERDRSDEELLENANNIAFAISLRTSTNFANSTNINGIRDVDVRKREMLKKNRGHVKYSVSSSTSSVSVSTPVTTKPTNRTTTNHEKTIEQTMIRPNVTQPHSKYKYNHDYVEDDSLEIIQMEE